MGNMPHDEVTRIMNAMKAAGMNKKELCAALGYKGQQIFTKWIDGRSTSYRQQIFQIADILGVSADYLLGKTDDPRSTLEKSTIERVSEHYVHDWHDVWVHSKAPPSLRGVGGAFSFSSKTVYFCTA